MRKLTTLALCTLFAATAALAQEPKKPLSPPAKAEATINGKKVTIDYSAPSKRNRVIMGELVPYGKVWRTGANAATTLTTEADLMIGSLHVPAGKYTLYTIPGEKEWTLIVNKQTGQWGTNYDESKDLGRAKIKAVPVKDTVETFTIGVGDTLSFTWENTKAWAPLMVH
ncbi:MAG TPA: DUF2911 domain-containing protein [Thermoanaerobaculia bacterium]|jgi:hypothetical protein|nr:DUF2911 domain-containing protein [Thermoanaerobaculia bacterium]